MTPELFLSCGGELRDIEEELSEYVRYCYGYLSKFSFFSLSPCPFSQSSFRAEMLIPTHIYLQNFVSIQPRTSPVKFARSLATNQCKPAVADVPPRGAGCLAAFTADGGLRQTSQGSFSAVSKRNFARKYAFESSRRDLHNALLCTALKSHMFF